MIHIFLCDGKYPKHRRVLSCCRSPLSELSEVCNAYSSESHLFFSLASRLKSRSPSYLIRKKRGKRFLRKPRSGKWTKIRLLVLRKTRGWWACGVLRLSPLRWQMYKVRCSEGKTPAAVPPNVTRWRCRWHAAHPTGGPTSSSPRNLGAEPFHAPSLAVIRGQWGFEKQDCSERGMAAPSSSLQRYCTSLASP